MKKIISTIIFTVFLFALAGCNSVPEIPADASSTQLIQLGQDAMGISN